VLVAAAVKSNKGAIMIASNDIGLNRDEMLDAFVAALVNAAYPVALRHGARGSWVDLELQLWKALTETVQMWDQNWGWPPARESKSHSANRCR
jgi:hypothetical protein